MGLWSDTRFGCSCGEEDAERVAGGVGVDAEGFLGVVGVVGQECAAEGEGAGVLGGEVGEGGDGEVEVEHRGVGSVGPGGCW